MKNFLLPKCGSRQIFLQVLWQFFDSELRFRFSDRFFVVLATRLPKPRRSWEPRGNISSLSNWLGTKDPSPRTFCPRIRSWGGRIRTYECRLQRAMPYHLATPQGRMRNNGVKSAGQAFQCSVQSAVPYRLPARDSFSGGGATPQHLSNKFRFT